MIEGLTQLGFSMVENPGAYALLLGSGISRSAEIPTGWEIVLDLTRRVAAAEGVTENQDWEAWYRKRFAAEPSYSSLLDALSLTPAERRSILQGYIEPSEDDLAQGRKTPTRAHRAIAELVRDGHVRVLITTNFDRLLERALSEVGVEPTAIKSVDDLKGSIPLSHSRCFLLKVHGDYLDNRILNTEDELAAYPAEYEGLLDRMLDEYGLIVAGWSAEWDPALRAAISRSPNRRFATFWAARGEPSITAQDLISLRRAKIIKANDADTFFSQLQETVDILTKSRREDPRSVELLVARAKRFLAQPYEHRIELTELVLEEVTELSRRLQSDEFPVSGGYATMDLFIDRWDAIEAASEPATSLAFTVGRWGNGSDLEFAQDALRSLYSAPPRSGTTILLELSKYSAYLFFVSYAVGLAKAARFEDLFSWCTTDLPNDYEDSRIPVRSIFLNFWEINRDHWRQRPGYEQRHAPWADHIVEHILPWFVPSGISSDQALDAYFMVELLGAAVALNNEDAAKLKALESSIFMPVGRLAWDHRSRKKIIERLERGPLIAEILSAGFSKGNRDHWAGVKHNLEMIARRMW